MRATIGIIHYFSLVELCSIKLNCPGWNNVNTLGLYYVITKAFSTLGLIYVIIVTFST